jgi:hypothetical protein
MVKVVVNTNQFVELSLSGGKTVTVNPSNVAYMASDNGTDTVIYFVSGSGTSPLYVYVNETVSAILAKFNQV